MTFPVRFAFDLSLDAHVHVHHHPCPPPPRRTVALTVVGARPIPRGTPPKGTPAMASVIITSVTANCPSDMAMQWTITPLSTGNKSEPTSGPPTFKVDPDGAATVKITGPNAQNANAYDLLVIPSDTNAIVTANITASFPPDDDGTPVADCVFSTSFTVPDATHVIATAGSPVPIPDASGTGTGTTPPPPPSPFPANPAPVTPPGDPAPGTAPAGPPTATPPTPAGPPSNP